MAKITKTYHFEAAHQLVGHKGKCARVHGHSYIVEVSVEGHIQEAHDPQTSHGFVMDFGDLDIKVHPLIEKVDHTFLNASMSVPRTTAEYIACWFLHHIYSQGDGSEISHRSLTVRVWETATSCAEVTWDDIGRDAELLQLWGYGSPDDL